MLREESLESCGHASVILDTTLPLRRLEAIVREVDPPVILSSLANLELAKGLIDQQVLVLCEETLRSFNAPSTQVLPTVKASANLSLVYTSGSTGTRNLSLQLQERNLPPTGCHWLKKIKLCLQLCQVRVRHLMVQHFVHTLVAGGCLCIPSQQEISNELADARL